MESKSAPVDRAALLDTLGEISSSLPHHSGPLPARAGLQNFEAIVNYCPEALWAEMKDGTVDGLVEFALCLGLRNPSEPTSQVLALSILCQPDGLEATVRMSVKSKLGVIRSVKSLFKQKINQAPPPVSWIAVLPEDPVQFKSQHPMIYDKVFTSKPA